MDKEELLVHYWQLPEDLYISLNEDLHFKLCSLIQGKTNYYFKNCLHRILNCPKWHAKRLFNREIRFTIKELETIRKFLELSEYEIEKDIASIGNHEDGTIITKLKLPFNLEAIFYVASHLFFDGSFRFKRGNYFYAYDNNLLEYHKKRLSTFGNVPLNFIEKENQLYFSYTLGYIAKKLLEIETFNSTSCFLSEKFKLLTRKYKILTDEVVKALIVDEGSVEDKIKIELANKRLVEDLYEIISYFYGLRKLTSRRRFIYFKNNRNWDHDLVCWNIEFSSQDLEKLYNSISPLPIDYKEEAFKLLYKRKIRNWYKRKPIETKKLIIQSLLLRPKGIFELANELCIKNGTILSHLKGHPTYSQSLMSLGIIKKIGEKELRRGGYTKINVYGIDNIGKAKEFLNN